MYLLNWYAPSKVQIGWRLGAVKLFVFTSHDAINTADVNQSEFGCLPVFAAF